MIPIIKDSSSEWYQICPFPCILCEVLTGTEYHIALQFPCHSHTFSKIPFILNLEKNHMWKTVRINVASFFKLLWNVVIHKIQTARDVFFHNSYSKVVDLVCTQNLNEIWVSHINKWHNYSLYPFFMIFVMIPYTLIHAVFTSSFHWSPSAGPIVASSACPTACIF